MSSIPVCMSGGILPRAVQKLARRGVSLHECLVNGNSPVHTADSVMFVNRSRFPL